MPACGPPRKLVSAETSPRKHPALHALPHRRFTGPRVRKDQPGSPSPGLPPEAAPLRRLSVTNSSSEGLSVKPVDLEIGGMHAQQQARLFIDGILVIRQVGAIRSSHLAKDRPALLHNLRDSKNHPPISISSPAGDNHFPRPRASAASVTSTAACAIVHYNGCFRPPSAALAIHPCAHRAFPRASPASRSYSRLLYCVALRRNSSTTLSFSGARPKFRMQNYSRRVDHRLQRPRKNLLHLCGK